MATLLKKMSVKEVGCDAKVARDSMYKGEPVPLCVIYGRATGIKTGENRTTGDPFSKLIGNFEAVCMQKDPNDSNKYPTNQVFQSGALFLPGGLQDMVEGALGDNAAVDFAFEILSVVDPTTTIGYKYVGRNLKPPAVTDDMQYLRKLLPPSVVATVPALPPATEAPAEKTATAGKKK